MRLSARLLVELALGMVIFASTVTSLAAGLLRACGTVAGPPPLPPHAANSNAGAMQSALFMTQTFTVRSIAPAHADGSKGPFFRLVHTRDARSDETHRTPADIPATICCRRLRYRVNRRTARRWRCRCGCRRVRRFCLPPERRAASPPEFYRDRSGVT